MSLVLIGGGQFGDAIRILQSISVANPSERLRVAFNAAMAIWGVEREPPANLFQEFLELHEEGGSEKDGANYNQCVGLALAVIKKTDEAIETLQRAQVLVERQDTTFSCWSYLERGELAFANDVAEMRDWIVTGAPEPAVFRDNREDGARTVESSARD